MRQMSVFTILLLGALLVVTGCNNEWEEELYTRMISLKAPINRDDVSVIYLRYQPDSLQVTYKLPVIVSGSKTNDRDYSVRIDVDNDTLNKLNVGRYAARSDLYYKQLSEEFFELPSKSCRIPSGADVAFFPIHFNFSGLDLVEKWVLPLTILPDPSYTLNTYKGRHKALLWIMPFNDFSGIYNAASMYVYFGDNTTKYMTASTREARVVDENTVFFYAGITEELDIDRPHIIKRFFTLTMEYRYKDPVSSENMVFPYRCKGTMLMQRNVSTLVPDEDQAIFW